MVALVSVGEPRTTDRELRAQIEEAEANLRASRQRLLEQRAGSPARTAALEQDRHTLSQKLSALNARIAQAKLELEEVQEALRTSWADVELVDKDASGEDLTVADGLFNAVFGQTPNWAEGQPFTTRLLIRYQQGRGRRR